MKLQGKIILLFVPSIVFPMLVLGWVAYDQLKETAEQKMLGQMNTLLHQVELHLTSQLVTAKANVELFARADLVKRYLLMEDEGDRYELLQPSLLDLFSSYQRAYPSYYELRLLLPDGYEDTRSTLVPIPNIREEEGDTDYFKQLQHAEADIYTTFLHNPDNHEFALLVAKRIALKDSAVDPLLVKPTLRGYLIITADLEFLREQERNSRLGEGGGLFFTDGTGELVLADHPHQILPGDLFTALTDGVSHQALVRTNYGGRSVLFEGRQLAANFFLFAFLSEQELLVASRRLGVLVAGITLVGVLLAAGLLFIALRRLILNPLQQLGWATQEIGRGNLQVSIDTQRKDELGELAASFAEMSENLHLSAHQISRLAYHDSLTGLANRRLFTDCLRQTLQYCRQQGQRAALLFLDLDNFKQVNDTLGHDAGDLLLRDFAERLSSCVRANDYLARSESNPANNTIARLGGDEFTLVLTNIHHPQDAATVAKRILASIAHPFTIKATEFHIGASIGITIYPDHGDTVETLVKNADVAMYHAKRQGKNNYQYYMDSMNKAMLERLALENALRRAIDMNELRLYYQPQVDIRTQNLIGVEALVRWHHPELGLLGPDRFIPLAEETGLIVPLGEWVLRTACQQAKDWQYAGYEPIRVSVNISNLQLNHLAFDRIVQQILAETGLTPSGLDLELTESAIMDLTSNALEILNDIKILGVHISMDDFGTGYSSLSALRHLPVDTVKIDRTFVHELSEHGEDATIVSLIIAMTRILDLDVIAEGVETNEQLNFLRKEGCNSIQGYLISPPVPPEDISAFLDKGTILVVSGVIS